ncbi:MAG: NADH-quinone oxidoreductase subunit L [Bryobacterales bacterium]|nr:NADH-quinone oxidoreductase subunit L [Bryobacterales bacterium]
MHHLWLIPFFPLAGFLVNGLFGKRLSKGAVGMVAIGSVVLSFLWALKALFGLAPLETAHVERYFTWIQSGSLVIPYELAVDRLTAIMLMVVTGIGSLIHIYATGYMHEEEGFYRFFAYLNLFMFFMLTLVLANNYLLLFVGWEGVGLCSYLLIGFYFLKHSASTAGNKAFIVNRIGDAGYAVAVFLIFLTFGTLDFPKVMEAAKALPVETSAGILTGICLLLLVGATGKSAQVPLYVWLPDAMEGPTPVSALIHAATMVTAGVYMVTRSAALFLHAPIAMETVAWIGLATAVMAATIGITQYDIKKVYAYSTVSQLGYMFLALGVGAFSAGIWHVVTHAFFKALLFLGAGSVIHALHHEQDMRHMGGLRKKIPITFAVLTCAWLAISGVPFTSGWYSKEAILGAVHHHSPLMYWIGVATAAVTAFYVSRSMFMTFWGEYRGHAHPHESPPVMWLPLAALAVLSLAGGALFNVPHILEPMFPQGHGEHDFMLEVIGSSAGLLGIGLAYVMYVANPGLPASIATSLGGVYRLVYNKYYVDEAYDAAVVRPIVNGSRTGLWQFTDVWLIDGMVNGAGSLARWLGGGLRMLQSGNIRAYAAWVVAGAVIFIIAAGAIAGSQGGLR